MRHVLAPRASAILYWLLKERADPRPFLLPANICPIVPVTLLKAGQPFEFVDILPPALDIEPEPVLDRFRRGEAAGVLYAHTYGNASTPADLFRELKRADASALIIDDRCLCIPEVAPGLPDPVDLILYSTGYAKVVELGFGGYAFLREDLECRPIALPFNEAALEFIEQAYKLCLAERRPFRYHDSAWLQTEWEAPTWDEYCQRIEQARLISLEHRREINLIYSSRLPAAVQLPAEMQSWRFNIRVPEPKRLLERLFAEKLFASAHYASLAGIMTPGRCPEAERLANQVINLFNDHHYTAAMAHRTCDIIQETLP
jgi:hypothetical protein